MKHSTLVIGAAMLGSTLLAQAGVAQKTIQRPCMSVNIQNEQVNHSSVQQHCDRNYSRTVQAGAHNRAATTQIGTVNDNVVRQYWYERTQYLERVRGK